MTRPESRALTEDEARRVAAVLHRRYLAVLAHPGRRCVRAHRSAWLVWRMGCVSAMRIGELLRVADPAWHDGSLRVWCSREKGSVPGWICFGGQLAQDIEAHMAGAPRGTPIAHGRDWRPLYTLRAQRVDGPPQVYPSAFMHILAGRGFAGLSVWDEAEVDLAGRPPTHGLRHKVAWDRFTQPGGGLPSVTAILGHRSPTTTASYLQLAERERDELNKATTRAAGEW